MKREAIEIGKLLFYTKLIDGASGNISFKEGDKILITKSGANLDSLDISDFVSIEDSSASRDKNVHAKIYAYTDFNAVVHCHGIFNVVLSLKEDEIFPLDLEGRIYFRKIPVVKEEFGSEDYADKVAEFVRDSGVAVARGHGIYSGGKNLRDAFNRACYVEHSCEILYYSKLLNELEHCKSWKEF
ncbi:MAG: class II aldolase/adducin family protein [Archaeoglobaceae archaeon]|nr:class II aldolase/adducin family protein [Archaeoglobaceae archaeon]MDW7989184.1 class II aldolase/adducin family protein [Archaeoglobaceae archaeon]